MTLYLPEKYTVVFGEGAFGLCTCWTDPGHVARRNPSILRKFLIIGSLYSKEGVSIMLRNLALNPAIRYLFLYAGSQLSKTAFGSAGWKTLKDLWAYGVDDDNKVINNGFQIHREISTTAIKDIIAHVQLVDVSELNLDETLSEVCSDPDNYPLLENYADAREFPETKRDTNVPLPSESVGWSVRGKTIIEAWLRVVDRLLRYGIVKGTDYGNRQKELQCITWVIEDQPVQNIHIPPWPEELLKLISLNEQSCKEYQTSMLSTKVPEGTSYTYGSRLGNYPDVKNPNQIEGMISKIKQSIDTRRSFASTLYPQIDLDHTYPPCLVYMQVLTDNGKINLFATFRSHDIFKASIPNAFALVGLLHHIAAGAGLQAGKVAITSISAHIYEEEWQDAEKLLRCQRWESPARGFNEQTDLDPRGIVKITVANEKITLEVSTLEGDTIFSESSALAMPLLQKLANLDLLSLPYHYIDITRELTKAEIALHKNIEYIQDRSLKLDSFILK